MASVLLTSIAEALVRMDTNEQNECHAPFLSNYSMTSKLHSHATLHLESTVYKFLIIISYLVVSKIAQDMMA